MKFNLLSVAGTVLLAVAWGGPLLIIPGGELSGEVVADPVKDWSFATDAFVDLETRLDDPYSVELNYFVRDGQLYIDPAEGRVHRLDSDRHVLVGFSREDPNFCSSSF
jgi:hypothetical protein